MPTDTGSSAHTPACTDKRAPAAGPAIHSVSLIGTVPAQEPDPSHPNAGVLTRQPHGLPLRVLAELLCEIDGLYGLAAIDGAAYDLLLGHVRALWNTGRPRSP
jgi:hypothetical protein